MNGLLTTSSTQQPHEMRPSQNGHGKVSKFRFSGGVRRAQLFDSRMSYLKVLALSLLREIASAEDGESQGNDTIDLQAEVRRFETELIRSALIHTGGRQRQAARLLGTKVTTLNTKIKRYKIEIPE